MVKGKLVIKIFTCGTALARIPSEIWVNRRTAITGAANCTAMVNIFPERWSRCR